MQFGKSARDGRNVVEPCWAPATFRVIKIRIGREIVIIHDGDIIVTSLTLDGIAT